MTPPKKMKGLGRGLDALLAADDGQQHDGQGQAEIDIDLLQAGTYQPRTRMDAESLAELASSIKAQGIIQPISVRPIAGKRYEIIAGERRWRAARQAGLSRVPVLIRNIPDEAALAISLIENIQREDLNSLEEANGIMRLIDEFGLTHEEAADAVGRSRSATSNLLRLLKLAKPVKELLQTGRLEMGHARALLALPKAEQGHFAALIAEKGHSVREAEKLVAKAVASPSANKRKTAAANRDLVRLEEELADTLGAPVKLVADSKGSGSLTIRFSSLEQLDGLLSRLR